METARHAIVDPVRNPRQWDATPDGRPWTGVLLHGAESARMAAIVCELVEQAATITLHVSHESVRRGGASSLSHVFSRARAADVQLARPSLVIFNDIHMVMHNEPMYAILITELRAARDNKNGFILVATAPHAGFVNRVLCDAFKLVCEVT